MMNMEPDNQQDKDIMILLNTDIFLTLADQTDWTYRLV